MRIAMLSTPFLAVPPARYGGTELMIAELVEALIERGHDVTLFATGDSRTSADLRALFPQAQWPPDPLTEMNHVSWAMVEIRRARFDVVHAHCALALTSLRFRREPPLVYTLHHERDERLSAFYRYFPEAEYVAISADQARREIPLPHLTVVHHGLDPAKYAWQPVPGDYVCFLARFTAVKGPHTAIDVARAAGVPIRVAGEVHDVDRDFAARELTERLREPHVTLLGSIGLDRKRPLLREARALLAPLTWNEPFGLAMIEAMLSGCPVVAFPRGSVPELVEEGVTGFVVRDAAAMADVIRPGGPLDDFDRRRCRERAVERFGRARMAADYERVYRQAVKRVVRLVTPGAPGASRVVGDDARDGRAPTGPAAAEERIA